MVLEIQEYMERLREVRAEILQTLSGLSADALNWHPLPEETNSLFALATHCLGAERRLLHQLVGQRMIERDRAAEFRARGEAGAALHAACDAVARESEAILARLVESEMGVLRGDPPNAHTVRWCILHAIEHYNEHLGQMRLTRQLWENRTARLHEI